MKLEREVIIDLLPAYFSGESSAATRKLVEDYFRENPDFEAAARRSNQSLDGLKVSSTAVDDAKEKLALERARQITETRVSLLWVAVCFTVVLSIFRIHDHKLVWIMWDKEPIVGTVFAAVAAFFWVLYLAVRRRKVPMPMHTKFLWIAIFYTILLFVPGIHNGRLVLIFFNQGDAGLIMAVIAASLWITYFLQRWRAKKSGA